MLESRSTIGFPAALVAFLLPCAVAYTGVGGTSRPERRTRAPLLSLSEIRAENLAVIVAEDTTRYVTFKLRLEGSAAVRVQLSDLRLAPADKLYLSDADGSVIYGPIEARGTQNTGQYTSEPIPGTEVVIEWETGSQSEGDLPFTVEWIEASESLGTRAVAVESQLPELRTSLFGGAAVTHDVMNGMAVLEGDILLGPADQMIAAQENGKPHGGRSSVGITGSLYRWPNHTMPYVIDPSIPDPARVTNAIAHWNAKLSGTVTMVPRTAEKNYVAYDRSSVSSDCSSYVGMQGNGRQQIIVADSCSSGTLIHETGHAWGLWHEHTREDRDKHVTINWQNIRPGAGHNFSINTASGDDVGSYDYASIMHYATTSYSANGQPTITTIPAGIPIGQRAGLSAGDIGGIKRLYPSASRAAGINVSVTISGNPNGPSIMVDGATYATPATFSWLEGSVHSVSAPDSLVGAIRQSFVSWSNGGDRTQEITTSTHSLDLEVTYAMSYAFTLSATGIGATTVTPASADGFYEKDAVVRLTATPVAGYCFAGWTGLVALTPATTQVAITKSYNLAANFVPGDVTLSTTSIWTPAAGKQEVVNVTAATNCYWTPAQPTVPWVTLSSYRSVAGSGTATIIVAPNTSGAPRSASVTIGSNTVAVNQEAGTIIDGGRRWHGHR